MTPADLRSIAFLADCPPPDLDALAPLCHRVSFRPGQSIHDEHTPARHVCAVLHGKVLLYRTAGNPSASRLAIVQPGEMFGFGEALLPTYYTGASALSPCTLVQIDSTDFLHRFLAVPSIRLHVLRELSQIARFLICKVTGGGGRQDLALYLRTQADACGQPDGAKIRLRQKQFQPAIASLLNLSREHVTRLFALLKAEGVVDFNRGFPVIDRAWLDREAGDRDLAATVQYRDTPIER